MILVLANRWDGAAQQFADRYWTRGVRLVTPDDLSHAGWCYSNRDIAQSRAMVAGSAIDSTGIQGVLTRLARVSEDDVPHIVPDDRAYVAAEMSAFLLAWLSALPCPVLNRPTPVCLTGGWRRQEQWVHMAFQLGIPVAPLTQRVHLSRARRPVAAQSSSVTVTLVGQTLLGCRNAGLAETTRVLARAAGVDFLTVRFSGCDAGSAFLDVDVWPDIASDEIASAVLDYLERELPQGHA